MSDVADDMISEHPDEKMRLVIQKIKITTDDRGCLKLRFTILRRIINKANPLSILKFQ